MTHLITMALLALGVVLAWIGVLGVLLMPGFYARMHLMGVAATLGTAGVALAVLVQEGFHQAGIKAILTGLVLLSMNPVLTHATARAARTHQSGDWRAQPDDPSVERLPEEG